MIGGAVRAVSSLGLALAACAAGGAVRAPPPPATRSIVLWVTPTATPRPAPVARPGSWPVEEHDPSLDSVAAVVAAGVLRDHVVPVGELRDAMAAARSSGLLPHVLAARGDDQAIAVQLGRALDELKASRPLDAIGVATVGEGDDQVTALVAVEAPSPAARVVRRGRRARVELAWQLARPPDAYAVTRRDTRRIAARTDGERVIVELDCVRYAGADVELDAGPGTVAKVVAPCGGPPSLDRPEAAPPAATATEIEQRLFELMVRERLAHDLAPLAWDPAAQELARAHSADMAAAGYLGHTGSAGDHLADRVADAALPAAEVFENVGRADGPLTAHDAFMASPGHRANLMAERARRGAVGVAVDPREPGVYYVTELLFEPGTSKP